MKPSLKVIHISHFPMGPLSSGLGAVNPVLDWPGGDDWATPQFSAALAAAYLKQREGSWIPYFPSIPLLLHNHIVRMGCI